MDAALEARRPSNGRMGGKFDARRGGYKPREFPLRHVFSFVSKGVRTRGHIWICVAIDWRMGRRLRCGLYILLSFTVS